ncbi:hypothetical protein ACP70R_030295 [Stipagrostis hirtigluma subsp. patula]
MPCQPTSAHSHVVSKLLSWRRMAATCAALATVALLLAAPTTEDPSRRVNPVDTLLGGNRGMADASAAVGFSDATSSPSPAEAPLPPILEPISSDSSTWSPDVNAEQDMNSKSVLHPRPEAALWSTTADEELIHAKEGIANAPMISDDSDLYAPVFRNVSVFKSAPHTTKLHDELRKNTIKALCNADLSEGVFIRGKDVSLPETVLGSQRRPLRDIGGKPIAQRTILAFFAGQMHGRVRPVLLKYWGEKDPDMRIYSRRPHQITTKGMNYVQHMKSSKFCICPMGYDVNSPRIVEAIHYECVPVIIADNFVLPLDGALNWSAFSVVVPERDIPKLKEILLAIPEDRYINMQLNVKRVQKHFLWHANPIKYDIFHMILHSIWFSRINQIQLE